MYAQRTADDRIALGGRGVPYRFGSRLDRDGATPDGHRLRAARGGCDGCSRPPGPSRSSGPGPGCSGCRATGRRPSGSTRATGLAWAGGYVGTGVAATNLAGRTLTDLILSRSTELTALPWVGHRVRRWEPEPLRWLGVHGLYTAYRAADRAEQRGRPTTSPLARIADAVSGRH